MARLDAELVSRGIARSRERAKEMIRAGSVTVNGKKAGKPSDEVCPDDEIVSSEEELEKAVKEFRIDLTGKRCLDIGASTGGFTEYMLKCDAVKVFSVDVGHDQLAVSLRNDDRVVNMEGTDIRNVTADDLGGEVDFICADVSFISLKLILPKVYELLSDGSEAALLIKPQFEAGKSDIGKHGIVKDKRVHVRVLSDIDAFAQGLGFVTEAYSFSPIKGGSGNIEYLVHLVKKPDVPKIHDLKGLAESAFRQL